MTKIKKDEEQTVQQLATRVNSHNFHYQLSYGVFCRCITSIPDDEYGSASIAFGVAPSLSFSDSSPAILFSDHHHEYVNMKLSSNPFD